MWKYTEYMRFTMTACYPVCSFWQEVINTCGQVGQITISPTEDINSNYLKRNPTTTQHLPQSVLQRDTDIGNDQSQSFLFCHEASGFPPPWCIWLFFTTRWPVQIDHWSTSLCTSERGLSGPAGLHEAWHLVVRAGTESDVLPWHQTPSMWYTGPAPAGQDSGFSPDRGYFLILSTNIKENTGFRDFGDSSGLGGSSLKRKALEGRMCSSSQSRILYGGWDRTKSTATHQRQDSY